MRLEAGRRFAPATVQVASETQARCLRAVGLDPAIYGEAVAPALLGNEAYRALRAAGLSIDGWVETDTRFEQREPAKLGEGLTLAFHVAAGEAHPRGWRVRLVFDFARGGVETPLLRFTMGAIQGEPREAPAQAGRPAENPREGFAQAAALQLAPQAVLDFSGYVGNEIHLDPAFARRYGFRAPVAQGLMTAALTTGALMAARPHRRLVARVRNLRPVFWDDKVEVWRDEDWRRIRALAGGRLAQECEVEEAA